MSTNKLLISCFILCFLTIGGNALYFRIGETESKCFIEEILKDTLPLLVGKYKVEIFDKGQNKFVPTVSGLGMHVEIKDPDRKMVLSRTYSDQGQFSFTSHTSGEHTICLHSNSSAWFNSGQLRIHLDIQVGEHAQDYYAIAAKDKLTDLELRVRQLLDQVEQISKEQNYQRYREELFRRISESTNQRVLWWSILQTVILLGTGFWQMRHLKPYWNDSENPADATPPVPESLQTPRHQTKFDCSCCAAPCATLNE